MFHQNENQNTKKNKNRTASESISTMSTLTTSTTTTDTISTNDDSISLTSTDASVSSLSDTEIDEDESEKADFVSRRISIYYYCNNVLQRPTRKYWPTAVQDIREGIGMKSKDVRTSALFHLFSIFDECMQNDWTHLGKRKLVGKKPKRT